MVRYKYVDYWKEKERIEERVYAGYVNFLQISAVVFW